MQFRNDLILVWMYGTLRPLMIFGLPLGPNDLIKLSKADTEERLTRGRKTHTPLVISCSLLREYAVTLKSNFTLPDPALMMLSHHH